VRECRGRHIGLPLHSRVGDALPTGFAEVVVPKFDDCVSAGKYAEAVRGNMALAQKLGINAVPGFIIGRVDSSNPKKVKGISFIPGALPFASFQQELDAVLPAK